MIHIMIDLETLSTQPDARLLSIGAVSYTDSTILDDVYLPVQDVGGHVCPDTVAWWLTQATPHGGRPQSVSVRLTACLVNCNGCPTGS
ncbi:MAG: 3'-5' exoribonuclease [Rhodobacteraceae bacterium]|nr:3'-5' exoribonuclease [Paracoccaceae bacterium]